MVAPSEDDLRALLELLRERRVLVLTGAGCSTASGIPDYRGPGTRRRATAPVQYRDFQRDPKARQRYWARAVIGWPRFLEARPNAAHRALATLEQMGLVRGIITQNVDRLHQAAGNRKVIELHGALAEVVCLECGRLESRCELQQRLLALNPTWRTVSAPLAPDGDAELTDEAVCDFRVATCLSCNGILKPHVVFFGENVPRARVDGCWRWMDECDVLLVVGSSLTVFSGYRFVHGAAKRGLPVVIVNVGPSRGDPLASVRIDGDVVEVLPRLVEALTGGTGENPQVSSVSC